jgi:hypothetical protein
VTHSTVVCLSADTSTHWLRITGDRTSGRVLGLQLFRHRSPVTGPRGASETGLLNLKAAVDPFSMKRAVCQLVGLRIARSGRVLCWWLVVSGAYLSIASSSRSCTNRAPFIDTIAAWTGAAAERRSRSADPVHQRPARDIGRRR